MGSTMSMVGLAALTLVMHISIHLHFVEQEELLCESTKEDLNQSISEIASMQAEIQSLNQTNSDCTSDLAQANNRNSHSMEQVAKLEKEIDELVQQNSNCTHDLREERSLNESSASRAGDAVPAFELDSTILTDPTDIETFHNLLKPQFNKTIGAADFKLNLLYRYTRDGSHVYNFHEKCDAANNTLTLVESNYHNVFGGFTTLSYGSEPGWYGDKNAFLYRIKSTFDHKPKIFGLKDPSNDHAVFIKKNWAPTWGSGPDLHLRDTNSKPNTAHSRLGMTYKGVGNELCGGEKYDQFNAKHWFNIVEYEVYEVKASDN